MSAVSRREMLAAGGVTIFFALAGSAVGQSGGGGPPRKVAPELPGSLSQFPTLDSWIRIAPDGRVTVFTGKAELGQGIRTALLQIAADELDVPLSQATLVTADTARTPNEGITAGSLSVEQSGGAIANAAAHVRHLLIEQAAAQWRLPMDGLSTREGRVIGPGSSALDYGALASQTDLRMAARPDVPRRAVDARRFIGRDVARVDIPAKLAGEPAFVHDLMLPDLLHARVVRGPSSGTRLKGDLDAAATLPGISRVVRVGAFAALVGPNEWPLVQALRVVNQAGWEPTGTPLPEGNLARAIQALPDRPDILVDRRDAPATTPVRMVAARYSRPYLMHGSIGPSCAVALMKDGQLTVWTHSQGVSPLRAAIAELLRMPEKQVRCIHMEGAGCYGHNGADDVAADAALVAREIPGRPIKLLWSREQEHGWEPLGTAMVAELKGALDADGRIVSFEHQVWSNPHSTRPSAAGDLLAGREVDPAFKPTPPRPIPQPAGGGDRNAIPLYALPNLKVVSRFLPDMPVRVSALRSLGAHLNIFALESMIDELAAAGGKDPVAFRLAHLEDPRARAVIERTAARFDWTRYRKATLRGAGFAFARYKNTGAYLALALDVEVIRDTGRIIVHRAVAAVDAGEAVNPDGIRNQTEGGIVQSLSWSAHEAVSHDAHHRTALDWSAYPILRFADAPRAVEVEVIDRPGHPFLGTGEAAQGPTAAALANALAVATGKRLRDMPLSLDTTLL